MADQHPSEKGQPLPETVVQQSILQQAQAAADAQTDSTEYATQDGFLQNTDLITPDSTEDDAPLPAYGEIYGHGHGEIHAEKDGLGTSANVTDDGRVNIRINQLNRRLSLVLSPALRHQFQSAQDGQPPPPPYIPPSLGGEEGAPPPPPLNVVIQVVGSRGDVQPFVALGKVLKDTYHHRVRLATHPVFKDFVQENGLEFFSIGGDPSGLMAFMVKNPGLMPGFRSMVSGDVGRRRRDVAEYIQGCWRSCYKAGDGMDLLATENDPSESSMNDHGPESAPRPFVADCIIANPPSFAHIHCAEKLGIPLHIMFTMPYSPTQAFPHPLANIQSSNADPQLTNYISYAMIEILSWQGLGEIINRFRKKCLGLEPASLFWAPGMLHRLKIPHTYCWSPALIPKPKDWGPHISISGFYLLNLASQYDPPPELQSFLDAGPPPVYIGFGSIVLDDPNAMTELIFEAVRKSGHRVLLSKGWGGIGADELNVPDGVFMLGNVPHDWLFKRVSCVVHHGGAGTTAAGIAAGRPTVVVPFFGDQPFWGAMVARAGAGPEPIPHKQLTADKLAHAINLCMEPQSLERAKELASKIAAERGTDMGAQSFHQYLEADRLRCALAPSRAAAWRIKRTKIRLSAFAACTLANANLLDFHNLKLFRSQEYYPDEGPGDPISGFSTATLGAFGNMVVGLTEFPSETLKVFRPSAGPSRQQSQASVPTVARKSEISLVGQKSTPPTTPGQSQTSVNMQEGLARLQSPSGFSALSGTTSNVGSSSVSDTFQGQSNLNRDGASRNRLRRRNEPSSSKDRDRMKTGVHTSKGFGRMVKAAVQAPMDMSVSITKGFHNAPKLWGDDTVRPQEQISDLRTGGMAIGKEFAFGMYDGVTGLVTQPWKGARKEGTSGFFKGVGKGIGGLATKPGAALFAIPAYFMKGAHKEVQKLFSSNVQSYIVASRVAQGYEEWLQSSNEEKQDVISRWMLIQKHLKKKKRNADETVLDLLDAHQKPDTEHRGAARQNGQPIANAARSRNNARANRQDPESAMLAMGGSHSPLTPAKESSEESLGADDVDETMPPSFEETPRRDIDVDANVEQAFQNDLSQIQRREVKATYHRADQANMRQAMAVSQAEAQRHADEDLRHDEEVKRALAESLREERQWSSDSGLESDIGLNDEQDEEFERAILESEKRAKMAAVVVNGSSGSQKSPSHDPGHLAGTTQSEWAVQQREQRGEKTTQEKTEEEIVMEYVKKQSLLEAHHQNKGKGRAAAAEDEDLQRALKLSMQGHEHDAERRHGEASRS